jgi:GTP cyclohydrolase I
MTMRGVNKPSCTTVTSAMLGVLRDSHELRMEFYQVGLSSLIII